MSNLGLASRPVETFHFQAERKCITCSSQGRLAGWSVVSGLTAF